MEYLRPKTVEEALESLRRGLPLAGGTTLTPRRWSLPGVVDLQDLDLDQIRVQDEWVVCGAMVRLQDVVESPATPPSLKDAARREAGWNLRNAATIGGTVAAGTGRSPVLAVLLALDARVLSEPSSRERELDRFLDERHTSDKADLITGVRIRRPGRSEFEVTARTPADRPLVCVAAAHWAGSDPAWRVALGGSGRRPILVPTAAGGDPMAAAAEARRIYADAADEWASAEYRSAVAGVLVRRILERMAA